MKKGIIILIVAGALAFTYSCKKQKEEPVTTTTPLEFTSLTANPAIVEIGQTSTITAIAKGDNITYQWNMSHGDLFGSGTTVVYGAQACCVGLNTVSCIVTGSGTSITKTVTVEVLQGGH